VSGFLAVIDPPWGADAGGGGRGAQNHYALDDASGVAEGYYGARDNNGKRIWPALNTRDPMLVFMWATAGAMSQKENGNPPDAYVLARLLAVRVCAMTVWCKIDEAILPEHLGGNPMHLTMQPAIVMMDDGEPLHRAPRRMGLGQWTRVEHEYLLICRRGILPVPATDCRPRSVIYAPRGQHSAKPEKAWTQVIEPIARSSMPGVVGIEFNCRSQRAGWRAFGALDGEDKRLRYEEALT
jgi:hypothetical protein